MGKIVKFSRFALNDAKKENNASNLKQRFTEFTKTISLNARKQTALLIAERAALGFFTVLFAGLVITYFLLW